MDTDTKLKIEELEQNIKEINDKILIIEEKIESILFKIDFIAPYRTNDDY